MSYTCSKYIFDWLDVCNCTGASNGTVRSHVKTKTHLVMAREYAALKTTAERGLKEQGPACQKTLLCVLISAHHCHKQKMKV